MSIDSDINAIVTCVNRYARGLDLFDPKEAMSAFSSDAIMDGTAAGLKLLEGAEQLLSFFETNAAGTEEQFHLVTNHIIELLEGSDTAIGTNYVHTQGVTKDGHRFSATVINEDRYRKTSAGWLITHRVMRPLVNSQK